MTGIRIRRNKLVIAVVALALILTAGVFLSNMSFEKTFADTDTEKEDKKTINVSASAKVTASPDIAYVSFGVVTEDEDAKAAQENNSMAMNKVIDAIKDAGIAEKDIKTTNYSIYPKYNYIKETGESEIIGYSVNNTVEVTIRDLDKTGEILAIAADAGVNISNNIRFGLSDNEEYYRQALKEAAKKAKGRAEAIAEELDIKIKSPIKISESGNAYPIYRAEYSKAVTMDFAEGSVPVQAGTLEVSATVSITYEY